MYYMIKNKSSSYFRLTESVEVEFTVYFLADKFINKEFCEKVIKRFNLKEVEIIEFKEVL